MITYPEFPFYMYRFCKEGKEAVEYLNALPKEARVVSIHTTDAGHYHILVVRERQAGE